MQSRSELQFWFNDNEEDDEEIEEAMNNIKAFISLIHNAAAENQLSHRSN